VSFVGERASVALKVTREGGERYFRRLDVSGLRVPCTDRSTTTRSRSVHDRVKLDEEGAFRTEGRRGDRDDGRLVETAGTIGSRRARGVFRYVFQKPGDSVVCETGRLRWNARATRAGAMTCAGLEATIVGSDKTEALAGTPGPDVIAGGKGKDVIKAGAGADVICSGGGNDRSFGEDGHDVIFSQGGGDPHGFEPVKGGPGDDRLIGSRGWQALIGGRGRDVLRGARSFDYVYGNGQADKLFGGDGPDIMFARNGDDLLRGDAGKDHLFGGVGEDECRGAAPAPSDGRDADKADETCRSLEERGRSRKATCVTPTPDVFGWRVMPPYRWITRQWVPFGPRACPGLRYGPQSASALIDQLAAVRVSSSTPLTVTLRSCGSIATLSITRLRSTGPDPAGSS
jgi:hypothetical protein